MKVWIDGKIKDLQSAGISGLSHTLHYGTGVFEGIRSYSTVSGTHIFRLNDHIARLLASAKILGMKIPFKKQDLIDACVEVVQVNDLGNAYIRPLAIFGHGGMGLDVEGENSNPVQVLIAAWEWESYFSSPTPGLDVYISDWRRIFPHGKAVQAKAVGNYLNSYMAYTDAKKRGYDEAILIDSHGHLAEASASNLFMIKDGELLTPHTTSALDGITRDTIFCLARELSVPVIEDDYHLTSLLEADEAFLTGTACEVAPIASVNRSQLSGGELTSMFQTLFTDTVNRKYDLSSVPENILDGWYEKTGYRTSMTGMHQVFESM